MAIRKEYRKICERFDDVMDYIGCGHIATMRETSELYCCRGDYGLMDGITLSWMLKEAEYWLSCYYEEGNVRCDDRFEGKDAYQAWLAETGRLKRLVAVIRRCGDLEVCIEEDVA